MPRRLLRKTKPQPITELVKDNGDLGFDYHVRLSNRRSAAIQVKSSQVVVAAPFGTSKAELHRWVLAKAPWVLRKIQQQHARLDEIPKPSFAQRSQWPYRGRSVYLNLGSGTTKQVRLVDDNLHLILPNRSINRASDYESLVRRHLIDWYKQQALEVLTAKSDYICNLLGTRYQGLQLRQTKSKWGHCTSKGELQYNWLIMQAPESVIDYLVAHECCHLLELNHGGRFWALVETVCPNYVAERNWLRQNGHTLVI